VENCLRLSVGQECDGSNGGRSLPSCWVHSEVHATAQLHATMRWPHQCICETVTEAQSLYTSCAECSALRYIVAATRKSCAGRAFPHDQLQHRVVEGSLVDNCLKKKQPTTPVPQAQPPCDIRILIPLAFKSSYHHTDLLSSNLLTGTMQVQPGKIEREAPGRRPVGCYSCMHLDVF
jgi:hypothetical protein